MLPRKVGKKTNTVNEGMTKSKTAPSKQPKKKQVEDSIGDPIVVKLSDSQEIRISLNTYKGVEYIDVRRFYHQTQTGEMAPTKKGVAIPVDVALKVARAIRKVTTPEE